jgi:hypothetical protein
MNSKNYVTDPSTLLQDILDTFTIPVCIVDKNDHVIMNDQAKLLLESGFDVGLHSLNLKSSTSSTIIYKSKKYVLEKKELNNCTDCYLCKIQIEDETIQKLKQSSTRLRQVLSTL